MNTTEWLGSVNAGEGVLNTSFRALAIVGASQLVKLAINVIGTLILVRILSPDAFGLAAMAALLVNFILLLKDFGLGTATVQSATISQRQVSTLFWLAQLGGVLLSLVSLALAPLLSWFFSAPELSPALMTLSLGFVFGALGSQHASLLSRRLCFVRLGAVEITALLSSFIVALTLTWQGYGWWSLIWQRLVQIAISTTGMWVVCSWRPSMEFRIAEVRAQSVLGMHVSGANLAGYVSRNFDNLIIGWYWGAAPLGLYSKAYDLLMAPLSQVSGPLGQVFQPLLGRLRGDPRHYSVLLTHVLTGSLLILLPVGTLMLWQPVRVTQTLLGEAWLPASSIVGWFGFAMCYQVFGSILMWSLITRQRGRDLSRTTLVNSLVNVLGFIVSVPYGVAAVAATYTLLGAIVRIPFAMYVCTGDASFPRIAALRAMVLPAVAFVLVSLMFSTLGDSELLAGTSDWLVLSVQLVLGYVLILLIAIPSSLGKSVRRRLHELRA